MSRDSLLRTACLAVALTCVLGSPTLCAPLRVGIFADLHARDRNSPLDGFLIVDRPRRLGEPKIPNGLSVRAVLEEPGNVIAVFQGHDHWGGYTQIEAIHHVTFAALIGRIGGKPLTWAYVTLAPESRTIEIVGEGEQQHVHLDY